MPGLEEAVISPGLLYGTVLSTVQYSFETVDPVILIRPLFKRWTTMPCFPRQPRLTRTMRTLLEGALPPSRGNMPPAVRSLERL